MSVMSVCRQVVDQRIWMIVNHHGHYVMYARTRWLVKRLLNVLRVGLKRVLLVLRGF